MGRFSKPLLIRNENCCKDLVLLKKDHIRDNVWYYDRSKTNVGVKSGKPLLPEVITLINKYYNPNNKYVFDILSGYDQSEEMISNWVNEYAGYLYKCYNRISKRLKFEGYFTIYSARYTAGTRALNLGADTNSVRQLLDHTQLSTTNNYIGAAMSSNIVDAMELLKI
jgi:Site-specific recombinase XerD